MGVKQSNNMKLKKTNNKRDLNLKIVNENLEFKYIIGRGGFGKVWKVYSKKNNKYYALKQMSKPKIIEKKSENSIKAEKELLSKINHPFIVNMHYAFQDKEYLYLVMDLLTGGDLRFHLSQNKKFSEEQTSKNILFYM